MSGTRFYRSWRGRLPLVMTFVVLMAMVFAAPGALAARNAVKQFKASIDQKTALGQTVGTWTETIQNCGPASSAPCDGSHPSTINMGTFQIVVPAEFRPVTLAASTPTFPEGQPTRHWTVSYSAGTINGFANGGTDKLQPGESIMITFSATPSTCTGPQNPFTIAAWGSTPAPGTDPFTNQSLPSEYSPTISGCGVTSGGTVTGPNGQTETVGGGFTGHVIVTFGGNLDCSGDPNFGSQWFLYHLPSQVTITPGTDYGAPPNDAPKIDTSKFPAVSGVDSSWYLICYSVPHDTQHPNPFATKGGGTATDVGGNWVGILPSCLESAAPPCVSEQYKGLPTSTDHDMIVITDRVPGGDPAKH
jgi:hypothetical protein